MSERPQTLDERICTFSTNCQRIRGDGDSDPTGDPYFCLLLAESERIAKILRALEAPTNTSYLAMTQNEVERVISDSEEGCAQPREVRNRANQVRSQILVRRGKLR